MIKAVIFDMYETLITHYDQPLYFSKEMAKDANIPLLEFQLMWRNTEYLRTIGEISFEEIINTILTKNNICNSEMYDLIIHKRIQTKKECFKHLHPQILPLLEYLKQNCIKIGLISNCFSEESKVIKESILYPYFDEVCLSYDEKLAKPNLKIYERCLQKLNLEANECLYIGEGGSHELETAKAIGMKALQACWYFDLDNHPGIKNDNFIMLDNPFDILNHL